MHQSSRPIFPLLPICFLLLAFTASAQSFFQKRYGDTRFTYGHSFLALADSGYLVAGEGVNGTLPMLVRLDTAGAMLWQKTYSTFYYAGFYDLLKANDGGYLAVGIQLSTQLLLVKTDLAGTPVWSKTFNVTMPYAKVISLPDGYLLCGSRRDNGLPQDAFCTKISNSGAVVWTRIYAVPAHTMGFNDGLLQGDTLFTTGFYDTLPCLMATNLQSGAVHFAKTYKSSTITNGTLEKIHSTQDGHLMIISQSGQDIAGHYAPILYKMQQDGSVVTAIQLDTGDHGLAVISMEPTVDDELILSGHTVGMFANSIQALLLKIDNQANPQWAFQYTQSTSSNLSGTSQSIYEQCRPAAYGGVLAVGTHMLQLPGGTTIQSMLLAKTKPDGLVDGCCIQPISVHAKSDSTTVANFAPLLQEITLLLQSFTLTTTQQPLVSTDYCLQTPIILPDILAFCAGDSVLVDGHWYTQPGVINDTLFSTVGCDTITSHILQFLPQPAVHQTITACPGDSVVIGGLVYTQPATVSITLPATTGCDTLVVYTLEYTALPQPSNISVQCPDNQVVHAAIGTSMTTVTYEAPAASTDCPCGSTVLNLMQGMPSNGNFPLGLTQVCYQTADDCGATASCCFTVTVVETSAVGPSANRPNNLAISIYPNPATDVLYVDLSAWEGQALRLQVTDALGRTIMQRTITGSNRTVPLDVSRVSASGIYTLIMIAKNGTRQVARFTKAGF